MTPARPHDDGGLQRGQFPHLPCRLDFVRDGLERMSGRTSPCGVTRSPIMSPDTCPRTEIRLGTLRMAAVEIHQLTFPTQEAVAMP